MAFTIIKILLTALYVATWTNSLPIMTREGSGGCEENGTDALSSYIDCSVLSGNTNPVSNANTDSSTPDFCFFDDSCCSTTSSCPKVGKCFDHESCSDTLGCDVPGLSAPTTSTFTCAPTQTCATSMVIASASSKFITFACFDIRTRVAEDEPGVAAVTPMPKLYPDASDPAPEANPGAEPAVSMLVTQTVLDGASYPWDTTTATPASTPSKETPLATDTSTSSSRRPTTSTTPIAQASSSLLPSSTSVQAKPTNTGSKAAPSTPAPSHTAIIVGGLVGTLAFVAIFITVFDYLIKRRKYSHRHSISDGSDDGALVQHKEEQQMAYGYYGTNRAGIAPKGSKVFEANAVPVELPVEDIADHRE
ncbi:hypothetical protein VM1G_07117 [Cytospora mali]|uniref:Uncharacterized protein n=1 Tax=Cytospora mali TaxID=578113 RepID=A0A194W6S7_CYTMA|nr:hypothetical protein VM1G_07117 [Valsa mali]